MVTNFVTIEVELQSSPAQLQQVILTELGRVGEPLRWAIVCIDAARQKARVEAVVITLSDFPIPFASVTTV
ncbi:hypothetical protein IFO70_08790 [Phormidium tenue FACHB-886]|nr:hypothetical protein [Phormidium tenue FACHB-886]